MADNKKTSRTKPKDPIDTKAYRDVGLIPAEFYNKKTGKYEGLKTFFTSQRSRKSSHDSKKTQKSRDFLIKLYKRLGLDPSEKEYVDRVAKAETKARSKKVTGPELTTPKSKKRKGAKRKGAKGMFVGPSYRHGHKDLRKSGTSTRIK